MPLGTFNEILWASKHQEQFWETRSDVHVWKSEEHVGFIIQTSKPHFSPRMGGENRNFEGRL